MCVTSSNFFDGSQEKQPAVGEEVGEQVGR